MCLFHRLVRLQYDKFVLRKFRLDLIAIFIGQIQFLQTNAFFLEFLEFIFRHITDQKLCRKFAAWHDYVKYDKDGLILYTRQLADKLELYPDEAIYLLYDDTLIGKNKSGFAVTERGLHWTVNFEKYPVHMTFDELARALRIEKGAGDFDIKLDNSKVIGSFNNRDDVIMLMHGIKFYADLLKSFTGHYYGVRNY